LLLILTAEPKKIKQPRKWTKKLEKGIKTRKLIKTNFRHPSTEVTKKNSLWGQAVFYLINNKNSIMILYQIG
jgi:hypothetical protein